VNVCVEEPSAVVPLARVCGGLGRVISPFYPEVTLVANSMETVKAADFPFAGSLILPKLRPSDVPREFATSVSVGLRPSYESVPNRNEFEEQSLLRLSFPSQTRLRGNELSA
jgi:hypothetical protein